MNFSEQLTHYINLLNCSISDISKKSGLSYTLINRYINNKRTPKKDSKYLIKLADAIYNISLEKNINLSKNNILKDFTNAINSNNESIDYNLFIDNFKILQQELSITTRDMSKAVGYDSSFISRMKNKERKPADFDNFVNKLITYIISLCQNEQKRTILLDTLNCSKEDFENNNNFRKIFTNWLCSKHIKEKSDNILNFLSKLDNFDLNDYINTDFKKIKIPTTPIILKNSKTFFGIDGRKRAEGEFLKTTLLSKSEEPIFFYSNLPMSNIGEDEDFKKKWVLAITCLLKRGLHLNMVHNLNRPINELLLGLENWIPIYMTGSISPYYFKNPPSNMFLGSHCTSGSVALNSECIKYNEKKSKFYLTTKKEEVEFEKEKSQYMLSKAIPLMKIYKEKDKIKFEDFINKTENKNIKKVKKNIFKNIDFYINDDKWICINKKISPEIHFVIFNEKLINAIKTFLLT